jgi:hypothetical protein
MSQLHAFAAKYPPNDVRTLPLKPHVRSTCTSLVGQRTLVHTKATEVPVDKVPLLMTFHDVEILHHWLIAEARVKDIKYVMWLCKVYGYGLRKRRDEAIESKPGWDWDWGLRLLLLELRFSIFETKIVLARSSFIYTNYT